MPETSTNLLHRLAAGVDAVTWNALIERHMDGMRRSAAAVGGGYADDAVQEALLQVRDRAGYFRQPVGDDGEQAASAWLRTIAANCALNLVRSARRRRYHETKAPNMAVPTMDGAAALASSEEQDMLRTALAELPERERRPIVLRYFAGVVEKERLGAALGCSPSAAGVRLHRAMERLRGRLARLGVVAALAVLTQRLEAAGGAALGAADPSFVQTCRDLLTSSISPALPAKAIIPRPENLLMRFAIPAAAILIIAGTVGFGLTGQEPGPAPVVQPSGESVPPPDYRALIEALTKVDHPDVGFSSTVSGSSFLPLGEREAGMMLLQAEPRRPSQAMTALVAGGSAAMPVLIAGLSDTRVIAALPPMKAMEWMSFADEYDWNRRTTKEAPLGVNRDGFNSDRHRMEHRLTVGDLCFNAIGQIVNRSFTAVRYQPSGGLVVNSPTASPALRAAVMAEWKDLTPAEHRRRLQSDFTTPDFPGRRSGAALRLAFYAPQDLAALVVPYLSTPTYDVFAVEKFVRDHLYKTKPEVWGELVRLELEQHGEHWRAGILRQLFDDLDSVEATEEKRISSPFKHGDLPRRILIGVFSFPKEVRSHDRPFSDVENACDRARFIGSLVHDTDATITAAVEKVLRECDDDYLALASFRRCVHAGRIDAVLTACNRLLPHSTAYKPELEATRSALQSAQAKGMPVTLALLPEWR